MRIVLGFLVLFASLSLVPTAHGAEWRWLGKGLTAQAWEKDGVVVKRLKPAFAGSIGRLENAYARLKRDPEVAKVVPPTTFKAGTIEQPFADGKSKQQLAGQAALDNATRQRADLLRRARNVSGGSTIDPNWANFRFDDKGNVVSWFDPVVPHRAVLGGVVVPTKALAGATLAAAGAGLLIAILARR